MYVILLLGILLLWELQKYCFQKLWNRNLSVRLEFADSHIYEGDSSVLKEIVINDKRFPLPALHVRLIIPRELVFDGEGSENVTTSDQTYKRDIFSFIGRQQITRNLGFTGKKRGHYELRTVDVVGSDFFFKDSSYQSLPQQAELYVFPAQVPVNRIQIVCKEISGTMIAQNRLHPDPFEFSGIRDYQKTDPMNHVNWKASARMGSLMVNQYDATTSMNVTVILDIEDSHILSKERLIEENIRIASSLGGQIANRKMPLRMIANAPEFDYTLLSGGSGMFELNQHLACLDSANITCAGQELVEKILQEKKNAQTYVLLTANISQEMQQMAAALAANDNQIIWVCPQYSDEDPVNLNLQGTRFIRWEVQRW